MVEETGVRREYQSSDKLYDILMYLVHIAMSVIQAHTFSGDRHLTVQVDVRSYNHDGPCCILTIAKYYVCSSHYTIVIVCCKYL